MKHLRGSKQGEYYIHSNIFFINNGITEGAMYEDDLLQCKIHLPRFINVPKT